MSRRRPPAATTISNPSMGPPQDRDVVMGPPPVPVSAPMAIPITLHTTQPSSQQKPKDNQEIGDKYKKLKRRYFELEEKHKEAATELQRSGERNVKMREERNILLDRIIELEAQTPQSRHNGNPNSPPTVLQPPSSAFPRSLLSVRARNTFASNLRQAIVEDSSLLMNLDDELDPLLTSRHVGPLARKREEDQRRERMEEEAKEARRLQRRVRNSQGHSTTASVTSQKGKEVVSGNLMTYTPVPHHSGPSPEQGPGAPILVSSTGTRLRLKPPAPPSQQQSPPEPPHAQSPPTPRLNQSTQSQSQQHSPHQSHTQPQQQRSQSPISPIVSSREEQMQQLAHNAASPHSRNGNGNGNGSNNGRTDSPSMTLRSSSAHPTLSPSAVPLPPNAPIPAHLVHLTQPMPITHAMHSMHPMHPHQPQQSPPNPQTAPSPSSASNMQRHAKPKRLKAHTVTTKSFSIPMVPRDKGGKPMLPLNVGIMTVISLGEVCMREHFHTERYIFPVGYEVTRRYLSTVDAAVEVVYHCTILDGGDGPKFQIVPNDVPDRPIIAGTATGAWSAIVKQANSIRNRQHSNSVSGPDFFGLGQNTIKHLIQELPNADRLRDYVWQNFVEGGPLGGRHAAVMPVLPSELESSVPIGAYYPHDREIRAERERREREAAAKAAATNTSGAPPASASSTTTKSEQDKEPEMRLISPGVQLPPPPGQSSQSSQQVQPGLTTIVLPPPTPSETLNIQEYHPPRKEAPEKRTTRSGRAGSRSPGPSRASHQKTSQSPTVRAEPFTPVHHTRSASRSQAQAQAQQAQAQVQPPIAQQPQGPQQTSQQAQPHHSPYLANAPSPPPVPPTFASIMNAYPAPGSNSASPTRPRSRSEQTHATGNGSASGTND